MAEAVAKARKAGTDAVAAALADIEAVDAATLDQVRGGIAELHKLLERAGASEMLTAAKDRLVDATQFVHAHFGVE